jgi:hypothetical protein
VVLGPANYQVVADDTQLNISMSNVQVSEETRLMKIWFSCGGTIRADERAVVCATWCFVSLSNMAPLLFMHLNPEECHTIPLGSSDERKWQLKLSKRRKPRN